MKNLTKIVALILISSFAYGQNETDVFRYSNTHIGGSARYNGMAGAFGAIGADYSVVSINPAGMGRFRQSDFSFTPTLNLNTTSTNWNDNNTLGAKVNINMNNLGVVFVKKAHPENPTKWSAIQLGLGYNRSNNFNRTTKISGTHNHSYSEVLASQGEHIPDSLLYINSPFYASLAYDTWLIDPYVKTNNGELHYFYITQMDINKIETTHKIEERGRQGEWNIAVSGNYNEKIYVGGSVGFSRIKYTSIKTHEERSLIDSLSLKGFTFRDSLSTSGKGIVGKIGLIYLPQKWLRLGLAYHSPTFYYKMQDQWNTKLSTEFKDKIGTRDQFKYSATSPDGSFYYRMYTPQKLTGSAAIIIKKKGMVSLDYELTDYTNSGLKAHPESGDNYAFENENKKLKENHVIASNLRIGAEYRLTNIIMVRGGVAFYQNGFSDSVVSQTDPKLTYAFGIGYRADNFYADFAYTITKYKSDYYMYDPLIVDNSAILTKNTKAMVTVGWKF